MARKKNPPLEEKPRWRSASKLWKKFTGHEVESEVAIRLPREVARDIELPPMTALGEAVEIVYRQRKAEDGDEVQEYTHAFEGEAYLLAHPSGKGFLVIAGDFEVKKEGITG